MIEVFRQTDKASAAAEAGENLNMRLVENLKRPVLLMLSAGSSLAILEYVGKTALGANLTVSMLDERFSLDAKVNNFSQLQKTDFYTDALEADVSFFGTLPRHNDTMQSLAERWEKDLKEWQKENPDGLIIATLGLGRDGHTAGIFPYPESVNEFKRLFLNNNLVTAYNVGSKNPYADRITTTLTFFKLINIALAFVVGEEKKPKLDEVLLNKKTPAELPAQGWYEIKEVRVFTDLG